MSQFRFIVPSLEGKHLLREVVGRLKPGRSKHFGQNSQRLSYPPRKPRTAKHRRLRCDCGQIAVTVLLVRVGTDPQYTIRLPLCPACLALEQSLRNKL